jgi:hypothetical protein
MLTRMSLAPTRSTTGAYSTPMVGVGSLLPVFRPTMKLRSEVLPTLQFPMRITGLVSCYLDSKHSRS